MIIVSTSFPYEKNRWPERRTGFTNSLSCAARKKGTVRSVPYGVTALRSILLSVELEIQIPKENKSNPVNT